MSYCTWFSSVVLHYSPTTPPPIFCFHLHTFVPTFWYCVDQRTNWRTIQSLDWDQFSRPTRRFGVRWYCFLHSSLTLTVLVLVGCLKFCLHHTLRKDQQSLQRQQENLQYRNTPTITWLCLFLCVATFVFTCHTHTDALVNRISQGSICPCFALILHSVPQRCRLLFNEEMSAELFSRHSSLLWSKRMSNRLLSFQHSARRSVFPRHGILCAQ